TAFWRYCKTMSIPESLQQRIDLFRESGYAYKMEGELFGEASWIQVMLGQGIKPEQYHPIVDMMSTAELKDFLDRIKSAIDARISGLPNHLEFIQNYCKSTVA